MLMPVEARSVAALLLDSMTEEGVKVGGEVLHGGCSGVVLDAHHDAVFHAIVADSSRKVVV